MLTVLSTISRFLSAYIPSNLGNDLGRSTKELGGELRTLIIRQDNFDSRVINVFDHLGNPLYKVEQSRGALTRTWRLIDTLSREEKLSLDIGVLHRHVRVKSGKTVTLSLGRGLTGKLHRYFHNENGNLFSWNRRSNFLDQITSLGEEQGESRRRVAHVHQLRNGNYDWELLVDINQINVELALATALIFTKTEAARNNVSIPGSRFVPPQSPDDRDDRRQGCGSAHKRAGADLHKNEPEQNKAKASACFVNNDIERLRVFERKMPSSEPRDFFNPPAFLEDKAFRQNI